MNEIGSAFEGKYYPVEGDGADVLDTERRVRQSPMAQWRGTHGTVLNESVCSAGRRENTVDSRASIWFWELNRK